MRVKKIGGAKQIKPIWNTLQQSQIRDSLCAENLISFHLTNTQIFVDNIVFPANFPVSVAAVIILTQSSVYGCNKKKL